MAKSWGFAPYDCSVVLRWSVARGILQRTRRPSQEAHRSAEYAFTGPARLSVHAGSARVWTCYDEWHERRRQRQRLEVSPEIAAVVRELGYTWDGALAFQLLSRMKPHEAARLWPCVASFPSGPFRPNWRTSSICGRHTAFGPCVTNTPKALRVCLSGGLPLWEVDIHAEHANTMRVLNGFTPSATLWRQVANAARLPEEVVKGIINSAIGGRTESGHAWANAGSAGDYARVCTAANRLGVSIGEVSVHALMRIGANILSGALIHIGSHPDGLPPMLLPLHDGFIVAGDDSDALRVAGAWGVGSRAILGHALPVKTTLLFS